MSVNSPPKDKVIGIIGGMGPRATLYLFQRIIQLTPARRDQDHLRVLLDNDPKIPDRTRAVLTDDRGIIDHLCTSARGLERAGADCLILSCNTSHCFLSQIQARVRVPILNMVALTVYKVSCQRGLRRVGLLATDGTLKKKLYQSQSGAREITWVLLGPYEQKTLMSVIYRIKAGEPLARHQPRMEKLLSSLKTNGAQAVVLGCTELSLFKPMFEKTFRLIDPVEITAREAVQFALGRRVKNDNIRKK